MAHVHHRQLRLSRHQLRQHRHRPLSQHPAVFHPLIRCASLGLRICCCVSPSGTSICHSHMFCILEVLLTPHWPTPLSVRIYATHSAALSCDVAVQVRSWGDTQVVSLEPQKAQPRDSGQFLTRRFPQDRSNDAVEAGRLHWNSKSSKGARSAEGEARVRVRVRARVRVWVRRGCGCG